MMKTVLSRLALLSAIGLLAFAFLLTPQAAFASTTHSRLAPQPHIVDGVTTKAVYPRLSLYRCSRQDGFNGNVSWGTFPNPSVIQIWGQAWDVCGTVLHVYLKWYDPGENNKDVGQAPSGESKGINQSYNTFANAGHISVTLCANWYDKNLNLVWTCGAPYSI
jgi:hypothetical protein